MNELYSHNTLSLVWPLMQIVMFKYRLIFLSIPDLLDKLQSLEHEIAWTQCLLHSRLIPARINMINHIPHLRVCFIQCDPLILWHSSVHNHVFMNVLCGY